MAGEDRPLSEGSGVTAGEEGDAVFVATASGGRKGAIRSVEGVSLECCYWGKLVSALGLRKTWFLKEVTKMLKLALPLVRASELSPCCNMLVRC